MLQQSLHHTCLQDIQRTEGSAGMSGRNHLRVKKAGQCPTESIEAFARTFRPSTGGFESARQTKLFGCHSLNFRGCTVFAMFVESLGMMLCSVLIGYFLIIEDGLCTSSALWKVRVRDGTMFVIICCIQARAMRKFPAFLSAHDHGREWKRR